MVIKIPFLAAENWIASRIFFSVFFLRFPKGVHMCPEISSGHLWIHCWPSQDHTITPSWKLPLGCYSAGRIVFPLLVQLEVPLFVETHSTSSQGRGTGVSPLTSVTCGRWEKSSNVGVLRTGGSQTFLCYYLPLTLVWLTFDFPAQVLTDLQGWGSICLDTILKPMAITKVPRLVRQHGTISE